MTITHGQLDSLDLALQNIAKDPETSFLAALPQGLHYIRETALKNGLLRYAEANKRISWRIGAPNVSRVKLTEAITSGTATTFKVTPIKAVVPDMMIQFGAESVRVTAVNHTAGSCDVARATTGTARTTIAKDEIGSVLSVTPLEGADAGAATARFSAEYTNNAHYFSEVVRISDVAQRVKAKSPEKDLLYLIHNKIVEMEANMANALWRSIATAPTDPYRTMNGFRAQIPAEMMTNNVGALLFADLDDAVNACLDQGVTPDVIVCNGKIKQKLALWDRSRFAHGTQAEGVAGGQMAHYQSAAGPSLEVKVDTTLDSDELLIANSGNLRAGFVPLLTTNTEPMAEAPATTGVRIERLARTGPADTVQILAYAVCQLLYQQGTALLTGITGVDPDGVA